MRASAPTEADDRFEDSRRVRRTLACNGKKASASGTDSDGNRMTPRASAFRESTGPVLDAIGWLLACGIAQSRVSGCRGPDDLFRCPTTLRRVIALATE
jgi:hypothetical protein